jgi:DNA-binding NarL/FixJ family response regulator
LGSHSSHRLVAAVRKGSPDTRVIVMDLLPAQQDVIEFIRAGASGFIMKEATVADFVNTIRSVALGDKVVPSTLTETLLSHIAEQAVLGQLPGMEEGVRMTRRELEIIDRIAEGLSNKEIAARLNLATYTIKSHVHNILEKLALHSRLQIAAHAHRNSASARKQSPSK